MVNGTDLGMTILLRAAKDAKDAYAAIKRLPHFQRDMAMNELDKRGCHIESGIDGRRIIHPCPKEY